MSIVRWSKDSNVYIYYDVNGGITCHSALDWDRSINVNTEEELIDKLKTDFTDHIIPEYVFQELEEEIKKREN